MNVTAFRRFAAALSVLSLSSLVGAPAAVAEGTPLGILEAKLQTTRTVEHEGIEPGKVGEARLFANVPMTYTQAGGHLNGQDGGADGLTFVARFTTEERNVHSHTGERVLTYPTRDVKDIVVTVPPGLLADPLAVPQCNLKHLLATLEPCPPDTQIGMLRLYEGSVAGSGTLSPLVNVTPEAGQSLEWAVETPTRIVFLETAHLVRTPQGYGFTIVSEDVPMAAKIEALEQTIWGVPADPSHDPERGLRCVTNGGLPLCLVNEKAIPGVGGFEKSSVTPLAFLTMPTSCTLGPEQATVRVDSWEEPGHVGVNQKYEGFIEKAMETPLPTTLDGPPGGFTGCDALAFSPQLEVQPDPAVADEPIGLGVKLKLPQPEQPEALGTPHLRNATITLPPGVSVSPGVVDGIEACDESGPDGINMTGPLSERVAVNGELQLAPGRCPDASTVGTVEAVTPLLPEPVKGHVYLARPRCGGVSPCTAHDALDGNLYRLYMELGGEGALGDSGIDIKLEGQVDVNPATGQITAKFLENPQTPFNELIVHLNPGPRASLASPATCGTALTTSDFSPWSAPGYYEGAFEPGSADATPSSEFQVSGCASSTPFAPVLTAGNVTPQAGQYSSFTLNVSRNDREQYVKGIQVRTPPGLTGMLSHVQLCGEAQANEPEAHGECPSASQIGTTRVATGAGSHPFEIEGKVYLTGPYRGAPFGLSIVTRAVAGPFNLGLVVVRARVQVDPATSALTVTTDETGPYALPQILDGVPLRLKRITVDIDKPEFIVNPTDCRGFSVQASVSGSQGAIANLFSPFAVAGCKSLAFTPRFTASTSAHTSRADGASLDVKLSYPTNSVGNQTNIARVKVSLPKQLPANSVALKQACLARVFEKNPADCQPGSVVGIVRASTPVLPVELTGPVYFVSHGGAAFPSLVVVLQGDGVRVDLVGETFIAKGTTSSTFNTVPDVPVGSFELFLPRGEDSALAANGNLCKEAKRLVMPTEFTAQNGAFLKQNTKIAVVGCPKAGVRARAAARFKHTRANKSKRSGK